MAIRDVAGKKRRTLPEAMKDRMWKKGESGNPAGRPPGTFTALTSILREELEKTDDKDEKITVGRSVVKQWIKNMKTGKERSLEMALDRTEGKVTEHIITESSGTVLVAEAKGKTNRDVANLVRQSLRQQLKRVNHGKKEEKN